MIGSRWLTATTLAGAALLAVASSRRAHAADPLSAPPAAPSLAAAQVGAWARYRVSYAAGVNGDELQVALVARQRDRTTWELSLKGVGGEPVVVKDVVETPRGRPGGLVARGMKVGVRPPFRVDIPPDLARAAFRTVPDAAAKPAARQRLTVVAGDFTCQHLTVEIAPGRGYELWVAPGVQPTGIVKFQEWARGADGRRNVQETWELVATGRGAKALVVGPLQEAPPPRRRG
jgi:hypothetical protein